MKIRTLVVSSALTMAGISAAWAAAPNLAATPVVVTAGAEQAGEVRDGAPVAHRHAHPGEQAHGHERMGRPGGPGMMPPWICSVWGPSVCVRCTMARRLRPRAKAGSCRHRMPRSR